MPVSERGIKWLSPLLLTTMVIPTLHYTHAIALVLKTQRASHRRPQRGNKRAITTQAQAVTRAVTRPVNWLMPIIAFGCPPDSIQKIAETHGTMKKIAETVDLDFSLPGAGNAHCFGDLVIASVIDGL